MVKMLGYYCYYWLMGGWFGVRQIVKFGTWVLCR